MISDSSNKYRMSCVFVFASGDFRIYEGNADNLSFSSRLAATAYSMVGDTLWHHIAATSTGTGSTNGLKIYFDGVFSVQGTGEALGSNLASTDLFLASNYSLANRVDANFDEFAIFGAELSAGQVTALYNSGIPTDITAHADIQHYYRMGDSIGDTAILIRDQVGGMDLDLPYGTPVLDADVPGPSWTNTNSILFDGVDDYAISATMPATIPQNPTSISWWQKTVSLSGTFDGFMWIGPTSAAAAWPGANDQKFLIYYHIGGGTYNLRIGDGTGSIGSAVATLSSGSWQHWCITETATSSAIGTCKVYVDGVEEMTKTSMGSTLETTPMRTWTR